MSTDQSYPFDTVVFITDTMGGEGFQASGVLISPDEVLTASHVVFNATLGTASNIMVAPGYDTGSEPFGNAFGTFLHFFEVQDANDQISAQQSQFDYAVIHLSRAFTDLGSMGLEANFPGGLVNVTGYPSALNGQLESRQQNVMVNPSSTVLDGSTLGRGSSGGPVWITGNNALPLVVGVVSSGQAGDFTPGTFAQITTPALNQIEAWVAQDDSLIRALDITTGLPLSATVQPYSGPVAGLQEQYVNLTSDSLDISVSTPNWFIHSGSGTDAIAVNSGTNVLDGGLASNFLAGGSGTDTFFVDDRGPTADIWSTVIGFHAGDTATVWGVTPQDFGIVFADGEGAAGFTGLTMHAMAAGIPTASLTLAGYSQADMASGRLSVNFGTDPASGSAYMYLHGNS
jgi:V8-like Glu-specific endopeptidase